MDWTLAITKNQEALRRIVAALVAMAGLAGGRAVRFLPRRLFFAVLLILRPAESALRRLIVIAASLRPLGIKPGLTAAPRPLPSPLVPFGALPRQFGAAEACRAPLFRLLDPLKDFDPDDVWNAPEPPLIENGTDFGAAGDEFAFADADAPVTALHLSRRLLALQGALENLDAQVRRLARFHARRDALLKLPFRRSIRLSPMRPGLPPGWRQRPLHAVDPVLKECHTLALDLCDSS